MQRIDKTDVPAVTVLGGAGVDIVARPLRPVTAGDSTPGRVVTSCGGVARNVAENLARLGVAVRLASAVGEDISGVALRDASAASGVDVSQLLTLPDAATASYVVFADRHGETSQAVSDMAIFDQLTLARFENLGAQIGASSLCIADANLPAQMISDVAAACGEVPMVCDAVSRFKCRRLLGVLEHIALLKLNTIEAMQLLDSDQPAPQQLARQLLQRGVGAVLMSQGPAGACYTTATETIQLPAPTVPVASVNGAGDALLAGVVAGWLHGCTVRRQLEWGLRAAALACRSEAAVASALTIEHLRTEYNDK